MVGFTHVTCILETSNKIIYFYFQKLLGWIKIKYNEFFFSVRMHFKCNLLGMVRIYVVGRNPSHMSNDATCDDHFPNPLVNENNIQ